MFMKRIVVTYLLLFTFFLGFSQNLDSLFNVYQRLKDSGREREAIEVLRKLVYYWVDVNPLTASQYAAMANQEASKLGDSLLLAQTYNDMGNCYLAQKTYFMATEAFFKAYEIYLKYGDSSKIGYTLVNIGRAYLQQDIADIAESKFKQAYGIFQRLRDTFGVATTLQYLGLANLSTDEQLAISYFKQSISLLNKLNLKDEVAKTTFHLAQAFYQLGEYDSSLVYLNRALSYFLKKNNKIFAGKSYVLMAKNYLELGNYELAEQNLNKALAIYTKIQNHEYLADIYYLKALVKEEQGKYKQAIELAKKSVSISQMFNYYDVLSKAYKLLADCYTNLKQYRQSSKFYQLYAQSLIQLYEQKKQQHFSSFQMNLETQNKERQIELLKMQTEKERLLKDKELYRRSLIYILIIIVLIVLFVIFLIRRFREKVRTTRLLENTNIMLMDEIEMRKKTEQELKNSEERYRLLFRKTPVGIMQYDENLVIIDANDRFAEIFHVPRRKIINQPLDKIFDRNTISIFRKAIEKEQEIYNEQIQTLTTQGIVYVSLSIKPYFFTRGDQVIKSAIVIVQDITQRKKAEELYENRILRKQKLLELMPDSLILVNDKGKILEAHLPHSPEKEHGVENITDLLPKHTVEMFFNELELAIKRKKIRKFYFTSSKGVQLLARIVPDQKNNALVIISQVPVPVSEGKQAEVSFDTQQSGQQAREKYYKDLESTIEKELIPIYQNLQRVLSFIILKSFIERMLQVAKKFNLLDLEQYAKKLESALTEFDVEEVNNLLSQFPVVINKYLGYQTTTF